LDHVSSGLDCLKYFPAETENKECHSKKHYNEDKYKQNLMDKDSTINMAKPFQAIPMPYTSLHSNPITTKTTNEKPSINFNSDNSFR
jgi:hypothetical protein